MQLSVNQQYLAKALSITGRAVSSRSTMPILSNVAIYAEDEQLRLVATNREISVITWIDADIAEDGATTIPARLLSEFVGNLPSGRVDMDLKQRTQILALSCGKFTANIRGISADEFPLVPTIDDDATPVSIDANELRQMVDRVTFAASTDENRPTLTGVEVTIKDGRFGMAATDGFRLSVEQQPFYGDDLAIIVPAKSLAEIARIAADATGSIDLYITESQLIAVMAGGSKALWSRVELVSELIDARFPDYRGTMPKTTDTTIKLPSKQLADALKVTLLFARDNADIVRFNAKPEQGLTISASNAEMGESTTEIAATVDGKAIDIAFNGKYFAEALTRLDGDVVIELTQPTRPGLLYRNGHKDEFTHTIMPMMPPKG